MLASSMTRTVFLSIFKGFKRNVGFPVVFSDSYWRTLFRDRRPEIHATNPDGSWVARWVQIIAAQSLPWLVCDQCASMFEFSRTNARDAAIRQAEPEGTGPADQREAAGTAARAWHHVFGRWPVSVRDETWEEGSSCSFCGKGFSPKEELALVDEKSLAKLRSISGLGTALEPPVVIDHRNFWKICSLCITGGYLL